MGLVAGRSLLYPADDDVAGAVDTAVGLLSDLTERAGFSASSQVPCGEGGRSAGQPGVGDRVAHRPGGDRAQLDEAGGGTVEGRDGEEVARDSVEDRLLLAELLRSD